MKKRIILFRNLQLAGRAMLRLPGVLVRSWQRAKAVLILVLRGGVLSGKAMEGAIKG